MAVYRRNDQRSRERYVQCLIRLQAQGHEDGVRTAAAGDRPRTGASALSQDWLEDLDGGDDVVEIGHNQIRNPERTVVGTSSETEVIDG